MFYPRKRYTITFDGYSFEILEPKNWKDDVKSFVRNPNYHGIATIISGALEFTGEAAEFLFATVSEFGPNANVRVKAEIKHPDTDAWELDYVGWVDFFTMKKGEKEFIVKLSADPITALYKAKKTARVELERLTDLVENEIEPLKKINMRVVGRDIYTSAHLSQASDWEPLMKWHKTGTFNRTQPVDVVEVVQAEDLNIHSILKPVSQSDGLTGLVDAIIYSNNDIAKTLKVSVSMDHKYRYTTQNGNLNDLKVRLAIYTNGFSYTYNREIILWDEALVGEGDIGEIKFTSDEYEIQLAVGESIGFEYIGNFTHGIAGYTTISFVPTAIFPEGTFGWIGGGSPLDYELNGDKYKASITISEESTRAETQSIAVLIHEYAERLATIILQAKFKSNLFGRMDLGYIEDGALSNTAIAHGMWFRGMNAGMERFKPISTHLQDFYQAVDAIYPIGMQLEDGEMIIEDRAYFYSKIIAADLGEVKDFQIQLDNKAYNSIINVGYQKAGGYEESQGLDEYNRETQYSTIIRSEKELQLVSKYRADGYGMETVRRDIADLNKDSKFDDHIWILDVDLPSGQTNWEISRWQKRFAEAPRIVFSPDTAINLWFSPINILLRHGPWLKAPLRQYLDSMIAFNYSEGNSGLTTKLIGGNAYSQNVGIPVGDLPTSANKGMVATFSAAITYDQLNGKTKGKENKYCLFKLMSEGQTYYVHIDDVKIKNGIGEFKTKIYN